MKPNQIKTKHQSIQHADGSITDIRGGLDPTAVAEDLKGIMAKIPTPPDDDPEPAIEPWAK